MRMKGKGDSWKRVEGRKIKSVWKEKNRIDYVRRRNVWVDEEIGRKTVEKKEEGRHREERRRGGRRWTYVCERKGIL